MCEQEEAMKVRTSYSRGKEPVKAVREIDGIAVELVLQKRTSTTAGVSYWVLSWRTRYSPNGTNQRFYFTRDGIWIIPAAKALEMMQEVKDKGGMDQKHLDHRAGFVCDTLVSTGMTPEEKRQQLAGFTGSGEDWGPDPFFVVNSDPDDKWKKVLIVNTDTGTATFRSITEDSHYGLKQVLRPGAGWWLDRSMMDANVQQMKAFYSNLRNLLS